jgi:hypothetical protein
MLTKMMSIELESEVPNMKVYITYDRYERDEWFNIYYISTRKTDSIKHCREVDLYDFISYGPDDCHSFQLQVVEMTKEEFKLFLGWYTENQSLENYGEKSSLLFKKMVEIFDDSNDTCLISTDGCSDYCDLIHYYGRKKGLDTSDDDIYYDVEEELMMDEDLRNRVLRDYIKHTY